MNHYNRGDDLSYKFDCPLAFRQSPSLTFLPAHHDYSSPTYFVSEYPVAYQFPWSMYDHTYHDQNHMIYISGNNRDFNIYNPGWEAQPEFSWQPHPVVIPVIYGSPFVDTLYYDQPYSQYQSSPITYSPLFEEKVLQVIDRIERIGQSQPPQFHQLMLVQQKSLDEQMDQTNQLLLAFIKEEEGDLPIQPESNLERQYLALNFNDPLISLVQPTITLENELVKEQPCITIETDVNNLTKVELLEDKSNLWDEPIPSLPYLPMAPLPSALESSTTFTEKGEQIDAMMELIETSQGSQIQNIIEEATQNSPS